MAWEAAIAKLAARGVNPGDRVAVRMRTRPEWFIACQAISKLGASQVGLNLRLTAPESEYTLGDSQTKALIFDDEDGDALYDAWNCSTVILGTLKDTWRVMVNETAREVQRLEAAGARSHREFGDLILSSRTRERVYREGRIEEGIVSLSPAGGFADAIEPAGAIVDRLMRDAIHAERSFAHCVIAQAECAT